VVSERELAEDVAFLVDQVRVNGYVVLEGTLPVAQVAAMGARFQELLDAKAASEPVNRGPSRYQMYLPWEPPFADPALYENPAVMAVVEAVLGADPALVYFASDTPLPGSDYQRVHSDTRLLFPETSLSLPAYGLVLNVPLVDCTEENGSLEFWPGTHLMPGPMDLQRLAPLAPSRRANLKAGSLLLRDPRMWHRGTPNRSLQPRPHLALVYVRPWYRFEQQVPALTTAAFATLSERGKKLLRHARIEG
jgi:hypothetical protein